MSSVQDRSVLIATVVVESIWMYAGLSILALMMLPGGSPISWPASFVIMLASFVVARTLAIIIMPATMPYAIQMVLGVFVVYIVLGTQIQSAGQRFDLGWLSALGSPDIPEFYIRAVVIASIISTLFWWRGGRLASTEFSSDHLSFTFRIGLIVMCFAAVVDTFNSADLKMFPLMFAYFAAGLIGLSIGHIMPASGRQLLQRTWVRAIGLVVGGVVVVGLLLSLLNEGVLRLISAPLGWALNLIARAVFFVIIVPLVYVIEFLVSGLFRFLKWIAGDREQVEQETAFGAPGILDDLRQVTEEGEPSVWLQVLQWSLVAVIVLIALVILARAFRRRLRWRREDLDGERESFADQVDPAMDMARLLYNLLPERFRRRKDDPGLRLPDDDPNIVDVFRVYFGMLQTADSRGISRTTDQTPTEYQSTLERVFPQGLVRVVTDAFNRACYGRQPSTPAEIAEMRDAIEQTGSKR